MHLFCCSSYWHCLDCREWWCGRVILCLFCCSYSYCLLCWHGSTDIVFLKLTLYGRYWCWHLQLCCGSAWIQTVLKMTSNMWLCFTVSILHLLLLHCVGRVVWSCCVIILFKIFFTLTFQIANRLISLHYFGLDKGWHKGAYIAANLFCRWIFSVFILSQRDSTNWSHNEGAQYAPAGLALEDRDSPDH